MPHIKRCVIYVLKSAEQYQADQAYVSKPSLPVKTFTSRERQTR